MSSQGWHEDFGDEPGPEETKYRTMLETSRMSDQKPIKVYTTAPKDYDYGTTIPLSDDVGTFSGKVVRLVEIPGRYLADYQQGRYGSGLYYTREEADHLREIAFGFVVVNPTPVYYYRTTLDFEEVFFTLPEANQQAIYELIQKYKEHLTSRKGGLMQCVEVHGNLTLYATIITEFGKLIPHE